MLDKLLRARKLFYFLFLVQLVSIVFSIAIAQIIYGVLFFVWLYLTTHEKRFAYTIVDILFLLFVLLRVASIVFSEFPSSSTISYTREIIFFPYYFIARYFICSFKNKGVKAAFLSLLFSSAIASLYAIIAVATGKLHRGASLSGGYYVFSVHLAFAAACAFALFSSVKNFRFKKASILALIIVGGGIVSTYTRSAWVAVFLCIVCFGIVGYRNVAIALIVAATAIVLLFPSVSGRMLTLLSPLKNSSGRAELFSLGYHKIFEHPFLGFGPETFKNVLPDRSMLYDPGVASWHNEFLQIQLESGIFALLALLAIYGSLVFVLFKLRQFRDDGVHTFEFSVLLFSLCVIFPFIVTGSLVLSILNGMLLKFIIAYASVIASEKNIFKQYTVRWGA